MKEPLRKTDATTPITLEPRRSWIFRVSGAAKIEFHESQILLTSDEGETQAVLSDTLSTKCGPKKRLFSSTLVLRTDSGVVRIRRLPKDIASDAYESICRWWYLRLEPEARQFVTHSQKKLRNGYLRTSQWQDLQSSAKSLCARYHRVPKRDLVPADMNRTFQHLFDLANSRPSFADQIRENYIERKMNEYKAFFDNIESNPLTVKQRIACIVDEDNNLVLAGAGTGKTSVMISRAGYLTRDNRAEPGEILMLAFGNSAAAELRERAAEKLGTEDICISTFHALGNRIIADVEGAPASITPYAEDSAALRAAVNDWLSQEMKKRAYFDRVARYFSSHLYTAPNEWDFESEGDYFQYLETNDIRTFKGERVKSFGELVVANFLFRMGIDYQYERKYEIDTRTPDFRQYQPDFYLPDQGIYIEYWGTDRQGNVAPYMAKQRYLESMRWKRELHASNGTKLIDAYHYERLDGNLLKLLEDKLVAEGVVFKPLPANEILNQLREMGVFTEFSKLMTDVLRRVRATGKTVDELGIEAKTAPDPEQMRAALGILAPILDRYRDTLRRDGDIDYDDMISRATEYVRNGAYQPKWKFILVDEFQDIAAPRANLIREIRDKRDNSSLFCVGDDWQSIYRFTGSDISYTTKFLDYFGTTRTTVLDKTFRFNDKINDLASSFVQANPNQARKEIGTNTRREEPAISIVMQDNLGNNTSGYSLRMALDSIQEQEKAGVRSSVLVLSRFSFYLPTRAELSHLKVEYPTLSLESLTIHRSKGQEADYVILLPVVSGKFGLPSEKVSHPLLEALLPKGENYPHAEERRLFYVAVTRARHQVFIITDMTKGSVFVEELLEGDYVLDTEQFAPSIKQLRASDTRCPECRTGTLVSRDGKYGAFYSCNFYPRCKHSESGCPKCSLPMLRVGRYRQCIDAKCTGWEAVCPDCGGGLKSRNGKHGKFWGCSNWSSEGSSCSYTTSEVSAPPISISR